MAYLVHVTLAVMLDFTASYMSHDRSCSATWTVGICVLVSNPMKSGVFIHLFLQEILAEYCLPRSSCLMGEMDTKPTVTPGNALLWIQVGP